MSISYTVEWSRVYERMTVFSLKSLIPFMSVLCNIKRIISRLQTLEVKNVYYDKLQPTAEHGP